MTAPTNQTPASSKIPDFSAGAKAVKREDAAIEAEVIDIPKKKHMRRPTAKQVKAAKLVSENIGNPKPKPMGEILREAGYSQETSESPSLVTASPTYQALLEKFMPDDDLANTHKRLLSMRKLDHMVFPLGPEGEDDENLSGASPNQRNDIEEYVERTTMTDGEIKEMLAEVGCQVRKIVHGDTARHVYFWAHDANAQKGALELAYKLKGLLGKNNDAGDVFNFIGQNMFVKKGGA